MGGFTTGLVAGCLLGVWGTFLFLSWARLFLWRARACFVRGPFVKLFFPPSPCSGCRVLPSSEHWQRCVDASAFAGSCGCFHAGRAAELAHCQAAFAALILVFWSFPHVRSEMIKRSSDRLALALFLILATLGSRLLGHEESPAL